MSLENEKPIEIIAHTNGVTVGEVFRIRARGLSDDVLQFIVPSFHLLWVPRVINALRPTNQTSASSLSLHIYP